VANGRVRAVLDFEFAEPAARALDVAMGLRMTMRAWETPENWEAVRLFCRGYRRWMPLTEAEAIAMPLLLRLRSAIPVLWWLRWMSGPPENIVRSIEYLHNCVRWLDHYEERFVQAIMTS
jgi:Ser/Thr protein kinase RdoA (MazF antagonist)